MDGLNHLPRLLFRIRAQRKQSVTILCQAYRHRRNALYTGIQRPQLLQGTHQLCPDIHSRAQHQLRVDFNARRSQLPQIIQ